MSTRSSDSTRVILIDDNEQSQAYLTTLLSRRGYIVHQAIDPTQGFKLLQDLDYPTIVILSMKWQGEHGDFIELVRNTRLDYQPYIVILLEQGSDAEVTGAYEAGADDYLLEGSDARVISAKLKAAQRAIDIQNDLYFQNTQLAERTLILERTLKLAGLILFEENFETGNTSVLFEPDSAAEIPLGLSALTEACVDEANRERVQDLDIVNVTQVFEIKSSDSNETRWIEQKTLRRIYNEDTKQEVCRISIARDISSHYKQIPTDIWN